MVIHDGKKTDEPTKRLVCRSRRQVRCSLHADCAATRRQQRARQRAAEEGTRQQPVPTSFASNKHPKALRHQDRKNKKIVRERHVALLL